MAVGGEAELPFTVLHERYKDDESDSEATKEVLLQAPPPALPVAGNDQGEGGMSWPAGQEYDEGDYYEDEEEEEDSDDEGLTAAMEWAGLREGVHYFGVKCPPPHKKALQPAVAHGERLVCTPVLADLLSRGHQGGAFSGVGIKPNSVGGSANKANSLQPRSIQMQVEGQGFGVYRQRAAGGGVEGALLARY